MKKIIILCLAFATALICGCSGSGGSENGDSDGSDETTLIPWIDTHAHPLGVDTDCTSAECIETTETLMDQYGVRMTIFMHPPAPAGGTSETQEALVRSVVSSRPDRFFYGGGGNTINSLIQQGPDSGPASATLVQQFDQDFQALMDSGEVVVIGETTALHLSYAENHAFEEKPANSALFLRLADLVAPLGIPIDIHIDIVAADMTTPSHFTSLSTLNPATLEENVSAFEALLRHNRSAKIVLAHVGRDTTGDMSAELMDRLMAEHSNLYLQIHPVSRPLGSSTAIVDEYGTIRSEWLTLITTYADRIVMGSDEFFSGELETKSLDRIQHFLQQLPEDIATKIGCTNPVQIYGLSSGC